MPSPLLPSRPDGVPGHVVAPALRTSSTSIKLSPLLLFARRFRGWYTPRHPARCSLPGLTEYRARGRTTAGNVLLMSHNLDDHLDHTRRRERDSNPRYGVNRIHAFQACAFSHSATSPWARVAGSGCPRACAASAGSGEGGIRTHGRGYLHTLSKRAHSATLTPLRIMGIH